MALEVGLQEGGGETAMGEPQVVFVGTGTEAKETVSDGVEFELAAARDVNAAAVPAEFGMGVVGVGFVVLPVGRFVSHLDVCY